MMYDYDVERDVKRFNEAGADPLVARIMLEGLFGRYGRERIRQVLIKQAFSTGVVSIATASNWQRSRREVLIVERRRGA